MNSPHRPIPDHFDLGIGEEPLLQNLGGAELISPVDDVHLPGIAGEVLRLLHRGVAPADDRYDLAFEEGTVAHGTVGHTPAGIFQLAGHVELGGRAAGSEDDGRRLIHLPHGGRDLEDPVVPAGNPLYRVLPDIGPELDGVSGHQIGQLAPQHVLEPGVVVDPLGVEELPAGNTALQEDRP